MEQVVVDGREIKLVAKHLGGNEFVVVLRSTNTVGDLKRKIEEITSVRCERQKLVGLDGSAKKKIKLTDEYTLEQLEIKETHKFTLIGTADKNIIKEAHELEGGMPLVINDLDDDSQTTSDEDVSNYAVQDHVKNMIQLKKRIDECEIHLINEPRRGKKLCVIDIDYTIFDCKATHKYEVNTDLLKRPHVEHFLTEIYKNYDICFWSQTSWRWLEAKLTEMSILTSPNYKVSFVLDKSVMFEVVSKVKGGKLKRHHVKPLEYIWQKHGSLWSGKNTVHIDDLSRNFAMNPNNGIKVTAFRDCANNRQDNELLLLTTFLNDVVALAEDVRKVDLRNWKKRS